MAHVKLNYKACWWFEKLFMLSFVTWFFSPMITYAAGEDNKPQAMMPTLEDDSSSASEEDLKLGAHPAAAAVPAHNTNGIIKPSPGAVGSPKAAAVEPPKKEEPVGEILEEVPLREEAAHLDSPSSMAPGAAKNKNAKMPSSLALPSKKTPDSAVATVDDEEGEGKRGADKVSAGQELVNIDFPEPTEIKDIVKAVALWTGKNVILGRDVTGKVQIISPKKVTKEEAYQAFLSALNILDLTTVETGKVVKIVKARSAVKDNLKTYMGSSWAPRTDEIISQIIPLKYVDAKQIQSTLSRIVSANAMVAYEPTNTLIVSDSGYKVRRVLEILELLDVQTQQPKVLIVPIRYSDPKSIADKVQEILKAASGGRSPSQGYNNYKIMIDERINAIIIFGPPRTIQDVRNLVKKFDIKIEDPTTQASIHVRPLDYADAKKLSSTLSSLTAGSGKSKSGLRKPIIPSLNGESSVADLGDGMKITAEESSNSLLITGSRAAYESLNNIIRKLDVRRSQVFIEAEILDLNEQNGFNFGTSLFMGYAKNADADKFIGAWEGNKLQSLIAAGAKVGDGAAASSLSIEQLKGVAQTFSENMSIGVLSGKSVNVPGLGKISPALLINMMKSDGNTKVLSSPHILTSNNEDASISVGETIFLPSSAINPTTGTASPKLEKENIDLMLSIKPNISNSNYITLKLEMESSSLKGTASNGLPLIAKRKTKQLVTVKDGQTVVISGLMRNLETESYKKIPLLGDIPILGWLFRNSSMTSEKTNLVIFLTPHVVHGAEDLAAIYKAKLEDREKYLSGVYGKNYKKNNFFDSVPGADVGLYKPTEIDKKEEARLKELEKEMYRMRGYGDAEDKKEIKNEVEMQDIEATVPTINAGGPSSSGGSDYSAPSAMAPVIETPPTIGGFDEGASSSAGGSERSNEE